MKLLESWNVAARFTPRSTRSFSFVVCLVLQSLPLRYEPSRVDTPQLEGMRPVTLVKLYRKLSCTELIYVIDFIAKATTFFRPNCKLLEITGCVNEPQSHSGTNVRVTDYEGIAIAILTAFEL
jgi:hypothetical protein